jgi:hypothetical protein
MYLHGNTEIIGSCPYLCAGVFVDKLEIDML